MRVPREASPSHASDPAPAARARGHLRIRRRFGSGRHLARLALGVLLLLPLGGCDDDDDCVCCPADREPPAAPRGLYSVTGNDQATLVWLANTEPDLAGYRVYWSEAFEGTYHFLAEVDRCGDCYWLEYVDRGAVNGQTYFYAVAAFDHAGNEGDLSAEYVWDTPRPDGHATVANARRQGGYDWSAFDFQSRQVVAADDPRADFFYTYDLFGGGFLVAGRDEAGPGERAEIQDMGYTADFDEIGFAPDLGWSPTGTAEPISGHTYVVLTDDGYYAKIRITGWNDMEMAFDWACQLDPGNRQLVHPVGD